MAKILVVDDEKGIRDTFFHFLSKADHEVILAEDSDEAMKVIHEHEIHIVVSDIILPRVSGVELLSMIRGISKNIQVILITGEPTVDTAAQAIRAGAFDYLIKPVSREQIRKAVAAADRVRRLEEENRNYRDLLEDLVKERTRQIMQYSDRLHHIAENTRNFALSMNIYDLSPKILELFATNMGAFGGSLYLLEGDCLKLMTCLDPGHQAMTIKLPPEPDSVIGRLFAAKKAFNVRHIMDMPDIEPSGWDGYKDGSFIIFPFLNKNSDVMGLVSLHNKISPPFTEQDIELGRIIASHSFEALKTVELTRSLKESEIKYRQLSDKSLVGIFIIQNNLIVYANPQMHNLISGQNENKRILIGEKIENLIHPEDSERFVESIREIEKGANAPEHYQSRLMRSDGTVMWAELLLSGLDHQGFTAVMVNLTDITERKQAEIALHEHQTQLQRLSSEIALIEERERRDIASDLHDGLGQLLAISKIKLATIMNSEEAAACMSSLAELEDLLGQSIKATRTLTFELSLPILYELGFEAAVEWLVEKLSGEHGLEIEFTYDEQNLVSLDNDISIVLFKSVRELLINVIKHAQASIARVSCESCDGIFSVFIEDDGIGFDPAAVFSTGAESYKFGLFNIRERLTYIGADLRIESEKGQGARAEITMPINNQEHECQLK